ncbi:hypothetical protein K5I29_10950 [Flavobacterium agricola]|uniref:Uncharacterized protein n=1 Tax=Flavobacterium agricola TaxID=2870839 RepID=A0ABY6LXI0_9FLAO|nr:hypothetical protein [Flavobacterium agricola]UYW01001.1 hypothetical protein K5I29_10950 [Flavobacterium agricola]
MKKSEVPQDQSSLQNSDIKELYYAVDEDGSYTTELSSGWEPKTVVQTQTLAVISERIAFANDQVKQGKASPIVYFMEKSRMDWATLADYMEMWTWRVKRHQKPSVFNKLSTKTKQKYADVFQISLNDLLNFKGE